jgi:hypothetical protein
MMVDPSHIVLGFFSHVVQEGLIHGIKCVAELELTPEQDTSLVGKVE